MRKTNTMGWYGGQRDETFTRDDYQNQYVRRFNEIGGSDAWKTVAISETLSELFHRDTGVLAPGKSEPDAAPSGLSHEERSILYESWRDIIRANCFSYFGLALLERDIKVKKIRALFTKYIGRVDLPDDVALENYRAHFTPNEFALLEEIRYE